MLRKIKGFAIGFLMALALVAFLSLPSTIEGWL